MAAGRMQAWTFLGRCQVSMGDIRAGVASYERALALDPADLDAWIHLAQARKEVTPRVAPFQIRQCRRGPRWVARLPCMCAARTQTAVLSSGVRTQDGWRGRPVV